MCSINDTGVHCLNAKGVAVEEGVELGGKSQLLDRLVPVHTAALHGLVDGKPGGMGKSRRTLQQGLGQEQPADHALRLGLLLLDQHLAAVLPTAQTDIVPHKLAHTGEPGHQAPDLVVRVQTEFTVHKLDPNRGWTFTSPLDREAVLVGALLGEGVPHKEGALGRVLQQVGRLLPGAMRRPQVL